MDLLILGGTVFLGRHLAEAALARGHHVTLFHRGRHALEPGELERSAVAGARLEVLRGDRREGFAALAGRRWDACVDTSAYTPNEVAGALEALASRIGHYTFVSSKSVYANVSAAGVNEDAGVEPLSAEQRAEGESLDRENPEQRPRFMALYGALKAASEAEARRRFADRTLVVRPGLIVGPFDPTDRFTYWPERAARGGEVLAPGSPERPVQFVDARDLAAWMIRLAESRHVGTLQATGPSEPLSMGALLDTCVRVAGSAARLEWVGERFLLDAGVRPWMELPLWLPDLDPESYGFMRTDCARAIRAGLACRPLADTVRDTLRWAATRPADAPRGAGMTAARERELLDRWRESRAAVS